MVPYIIRRLILAIPVVAMVAVFVFSLLHLTPGDPAAILAGDQASAQDIEQIRTALNLDEPLVVQFTSWVWGLMQGDLGTSIYSGRAVVELIGQRMETTISLMILSLLFATSIGIPLGVAAASKRNTWIDRSIVSVAVLGFSVPAFVVGYILAYVFGLQLRWLPIQGYTSIFVDPRSWFLHLTLPALALSTVFIGLFARITRASMIEILTKDYIRTARAKGLKRKAILFEHALSNAAIPIVTVVGLCVAGLVSGSVVIESVFALPGLGRMTADAILRRDYPVIQAMILIFSLTYIFVNLIVDILYTVFDPRVRY